MSADRQAMRKAVLAGLMVSGALLAPRAALAEDQTEAEKKRLETAIFVIVMVTDYEGVRRIEAVERANLTVRRREVQRQYEAAMRLWNMDAETFMNNPDNKGRKFERPTPKQTGLVVLDPRIRGKAEADERLAQRQEELGKAEEAMKKRRGAAAQASASVGRAGGSAARKDAEPAGTNGKDAAAPAENLLANGGFEKVNERTRFADGWIEGQWGERGKASQVRMAEGEARSGQNAILARAIAAGAAPGVSATAKLEPGSYGIRFWACADQGEVARVHAQLDDDLAAEGTVGDEWKQFSGTVKVDKKRLSATLRIWTSTARVRVRFDDAEIVPAK